MNSKNNIINNITNNIANNLKNNNILNINTNNNTSKFQFNFADFILIVAILTAVVLYLNYGKLKLTKSELEYDIIEDNTIKLDPKFEKIINIGELSGTRTRLIPIGKGNSMSVYWEMYVESIPGNKQWTNDYDKLKPIIQFAESPIIYYNPKFSYLDIVVKYRDNPYYTHNVHLKYDVPVQKWNSFFVTIDRRYVKLYLNKKLVKVIKLNNVPIISLKQSDLIRVGRKNNNFIGDIRNMKLFLKPIEIEDIKTN